MNTKYRKTMLFAALIFITANFNLPATPKFFNMLNLPSHIFGTSYAVMVFGVFLSSPIWGSLSDSYSRKKTLVFSTFFYGLSQIAFGFSVTVGHILFTRAMAGIFNGGFMVSLMATIVDVSEIDKRGEKIAAYAALMGITQSIGFLIGGALGYLPVRYVFFIQGVAVVVVSLLIKTFGKETNSPKKNKNVKPEFIWNVLFNKERSHEIFTPWIMIFLGITFFVFLAFSSNSNALNYYLTKELNFEPIVNGIWKATVGIIGLVANLTLNVWIVRKTELKTSLRVLLTLALFGTTMTFIKDTAYSFMFWGLFYFTMHTMLFPLLQNFALQEPVNGSGFMAGLFNAVKASGEMAGAILAGFAYDISPKTPFFISVVALFMAIILSVIQFLNQGKKLISKRI